MEGVRRGAEPTPAEGVSEVGGRKRQALEPPRGPQGGHPEKDPPVTYFEWAQWLDGAQLTPRQKREDPKGSITGILAYNIRAPGGLS